MPTKTNNLTPASIEAERLQIVADHEAKLAALNERKAALAALRAPVSEMLGQRADLLAKLAKANGSREMLVSGVAVWREYQEQLWGGDDGARTFYQRICQPHSSFFAAAGLVECESYIAQAREKIATIESELAAYTSKHGLSDMLPVELTSAN
jgi:hypothetical protein